MKKKKGNGHYKTAKTEWRGGRSRKEAEIAL